MRRQARGLLLADRRKVAGHWRCGVAVRITGAIAMADEIKLHNIIQTCSRTQRLEKVAQSRNQLNSTHRRRQLS